MILRTHWGRVTHICVGKLTIIGSDNGLSPERRQAIIWTSAVILSIGPLGTNFSEIWIEIRTFSFEKLHLKTSAAKWRLFYLGLNELMPVPASQVRRLYWSVPQISDVVVLKRPPDQWCCCSRSVTLIPEEAEDMWHAYNLVQVGDSLRSTTIR